MRALVYRVEMQGDRIEDADVLSLMNADFLAAPQVAFPEWALWVFDNTQPVCFEVSIDCKKITKGGGFPSGYWVEPIQQEVITYSVYAILGDQDAALATISGCARQ